MGDTGVNSMFCDQKENYMGTVCWRKEGFESDRLIIRRYSKPTA